MAFSLLVSAALGEAAGAIALPGATVVISGLVTVLGTAFGLLAWIFKRTFGHTIPRIAKDFAEALKQQRTEFLAEQALERESRQTERREFLAEIARMREQGLAERRECLQKVDELRKEVVILHQIVHSDFHRLPSGGRPG